MAKKPPRKPTEKQVVSWLAVLPPIVEGLRLEAHLLERRNPTWRFRRGRCELLFPVKDRINPAQHPTLEQFLRFNPKASKVVARHDQDIARVESSSVAAHEGLIRLLELQQLVDEMERAYPGWRGAYPPEDGPKLLAENVVNLAATEELDAYQTNAAAWKALGSKARDLKEQEGMKSHFQRLDEALDSALDSVSRAKQLLEELRDRLADEHGLPPVPAELFEAFETF